MPWTRNERGAIAGLKTTSYAENVVALATAARARRERGDLRQHGRATSARAPGRNVFYVVDGELRTPTLASGCLAGVTGALVLEWCGGREVDEPLDVLGRRPSEVFLVSTTRDVQAVHALRRPRPGRRRAGHAGCQEIWAGREAEDVNREP